MKNMNILISIVALSMIAACGCKNNDEPEVPLYGCFSPSSVTLQVGSTYSLPLQLGTSSDMLYAYDFIANPQKLTPVSSNESIVKVLEEGKVQALSTGFATISIMHSGSSWSMAILVTKAHEEDDPQQHKSDSLALAETPWNWTTSEAGVTTGYASFRLFNKQASISIAKYPSSQLSTSISYNPGDACKTTSNTGKAAGAAVAINGSYFNTTTIVANTFFASNGTIICSKVLDERNNGIIGIKDNGHSIDIQVGNSALFKRYSTTYTDVIAAGPILLVDGMVVNNPKDEFNTTSHPRSIIGTDKHGNIWMVVIDGRFDGKGDGAAISECSLICKYLGLDDAINLDGGGSSSLWTPNTGVINHPCDNNRWDHAGERKVPTVFIAK